MFLISKDGTSAIEVNQVDMRLEYEQGVEAEASRIYQKTVANAYNFGSTERAEKEATRRMKAYLSDKPNVGRIFVNGKYYYGDYDEVQGKIVFEEIVNALKNESAYFDMREVDFEESEN